MLKTTFKRVALLVLAIMISLSWIHSGRTTAASCLIERGIDPLDILKIEVKHNVFIGIDNSGSMSNTVDGDPFSRSRLDVAKDALELVINGVGEGVNWGFFYTAKQDDGDVEDDDPGCAVPQQFNPDGSLITAQGNPFDFGNPPGGSRQDNCVGLELGDMILPVACGNNDNMQNILDMLRPENQGGIKKGGGTANAPSLDQIANMIANNYMGASRPPGQKNIIIYLSDGAEDCACEDNVVQLPLGEPGYVASPDEDVETLRVDDTPGAPVFENKASFGGSFIETYNTGIMARHALTRIDPNFDGSEGDIFIAYVFDDSNTATKAANNWAWEASGDRWTSRPECGPEGGIGCSRPAVFATDEQKLVDALTNMLAQIGVPSATVSAGGSVVGTVKEIVASHTNPSLTSSELVAANGADLEARNLRTVHRNNVLLTTSVDTPEFNGHLRAFNIYEVQADNSRIPDFTEVWDAGEELQTRDIGDGADPRRIYYDLPNGTRGQLSTVMGTISLAASDLGVAAGFLKNYDPINVGAKTDDDAVEIVEKVIQGWRLVQDVTYGFYKSDGVTLNFSQFETDGFTRTWKLRDATRSGAALVLNPPRSPDADAPEPAVEYGTFYDAQVNRLTVAYLGANGGMLHAFRADNGYELYGYVPHDLITKLPNLVENLVAGANGILNHEFFIASAAIVQDAYLQDAPSGSPEWRTTLGFGRGIGGKFLTGLDITDVGDWDGTTPAPGPASIPAGFAAPDLLFTVGNRDGVADPDGSGIAGHNYDGLGETWSLPMLGRVNTGSPEGQWVMFAGSGYGCDGTDEGRYFYVLKLEDGTIYKKMGPIADKVDGGAGEPGVDQNALVATPALLNPHDPGVADGRDFVTRAYIGDLQGVVHKLDLTDADPDNWEFGVFFELTSEADQAEAQGFYNQPIATQAAVMKLSGSDRILVFVGTGDDSRVDLVDPERFKIAGIEDTDSSGTILASDVAFKGTLAPLDSGGEFFFDLPAEERMSVSPVMARNTPSNGVVFFATHRTDLDPVLCETNVFSTLFAAGVSTGLGSFDLDPSTAGVQDSADLGEGKITGLFHRDGHLYVSKSGGLNGASETQVRGSDEFPQPMVSAGTIQVLVDAFRLSPF